MKKIFIILFSVFSVSLSVISHAIPFNIFPKANTTLPTAVTNGSTVTAYYTVVNNTASTRNNNYVKWLPPNVTQVTSNGTYGDTCNATFDLAPKGQSGDSCTLQLVVSGAVNANDSNPNNHLFVCFPGGISCAGTNTPLNVHIADGPGLNSITIAPSSVADANPNTDINLAVGSGAITQLIATGHYDNNTTADITASVNWSSSDPSIATVGTGGNNNGLTTANIIMGQTTISATQDGIQGSSTLSVVPFAYVASFISNDSIIYRCGVEISNQIGVCTRTTTNTPINAWGIGANPTSPSVYISDTGNGSDATIYFCPITNTGDITTCTNTNYNNNILGGQPAHYIAINPIGTIAYMTDGNGFGHIGYCKINSGDGSLSACSRLCMASYCGGYGITISPDNKWAYIIGRSQTFSQSKIYACPIINSGSDAGTFGSCSEIYTTGNNDLLYGLTINSSGNTLYATNSGDGSTINIYTCPISTPGQSVSCTITQQTLTVSGNYSYIALNPAGNYAYTLGNVGGSSSNSFCSAPTTNLSSCTAPTAPSSFEQLQGIAVF